MHYVEFKISQVVFSFQMFSDFLKTGLMLTSSLELLFDCLDTALYLQAKNLITLCNVGIVNLMTVHNCDEIEEFYTKYNLLNEILIVQTYRREHIMEYSETDGFLDKNFNDVCLLLDSTGLNVPSELAVWKLVLKWLKANREEIDRLCPSGKMADLMPVFKKLIGVVRFPSVPMQHLRSLEKSLYVDHFK